MKKILAFVFALLLLILSGCGKDSAAARVDKMIEALGETVTLESEEAIVAAEEAYNALSDEQKAQVEYADFLPIYRNNLDILKQQAHYEEVKASLVGDWINIADDEEPAISLREDGTATITDFEYSWTLNPNLETIRFEGSSQIVFGLQFCDDTIALYNPSLMTCLKQDYYRSVKADLLRTVLVSSSNIRNYVGKAVDVGAVLDSEGNETKDRLFAFHSNAYDDGLIYFQCSFDFAMDYSAGRSLGGALYEPFDAVPYNNEKELETLKVTEATGTITFIKAENVSSVTFDPDTAERVITLTNGLQLVSSSRMNPTVNGNTYNAYAYLADPNFIF